jgi:hypothetical protein
MPASISSTQLPAQCDLGIVTVIDVELQQVLKAFDIPERRRQQRGAFYFWETTATPRKPNET